MYKWDLRGCGGVEGGSFGVIDTTGRQIVPLELEYISPFIDGCAAAREDGKWGVLQRDGSWLITPQHQWIDAFSDGLARFTDKGLFGYLGTHGQVAIAATFDDASSFQDGVARVKTRFGWYALGRKGMLVSKNAYREMGVAHQGCVAVMNDKEEWNVLDPKGQLISESWFPAIRQPGDGVWPVQVDGGWSLLQPDGSCCGRFEEVVAPTEGRVKVRSSGKWGYVDLRGEPIAALRYDDAYPYEGQHAAVQREGKWTFLNLEGAEICPPRFAGPSTFSEGLAPVCEGGKWGYLDPQGRMAIPARFDSARAFSDGVAMVQDVSWVTPGLMPLDGIHQVPAEGFAHPLFSGAGAKQHVVAVIGFGRRVSVNESLPALQRIRLWEMAVRPSNSAPIVFASAPWP